MKIAYFVSLILPLLLVATSVFLKKHFIVYPFALTDGIYTFYTYAFTLLTSKYLWLSLLSMLLGGISWAYIINHMELSVAYPLTSISYIYMIIADKVFFGTPINMTSLIGILLILTGIYLVIK